jgi:hypothetical protein
MLISRIQQRTSAHRLNQAKVKVHLDIQHASENTSTRQKNRRVRVLFVNLQASQTATDSRTTTKTPKNRRGTAAVLRLEAF